MQECGAGEKEESPRMAVAEDHSLLKSSNLNPEDRQDVADSDDEISEIIHARVALKMLISQLNSKQQNADLREEMLNCTRQLKQENETLKSEMSSVLSEGERKTGILIKLIHVQWAQQAQLEEEYRLALDKNCQDLAEKSMMIEELLATIQELRTNNQDLAVQLSPVQCSEKGWWRRQRDKVVKGMATFRLRFKRSVGVRTSKREGDSILNVGFLCEYDALPGIGHACGHNLIAEVGAAAALGLKDALEGEPDLPFRLKVTVMGTPAEEDGGGKVDLILAGAFADMDLVFMAHPAQQDVAFLPCVSIIVVTVKYHGKASHAAAYPWEGVNALDAAVLAYSNLSALRQQIKPDWRLHGIIKHGGVKPNIIPDYTELEFYLRTPLFKDLDVLKAKAEACFRSAAMATGCQVEVTYPQHAYCNILPNSILEQLYVENGRALGVQFEEVLHNFSGSTDFGNVSFLVPGIHPFFYIGSDALNHTKEYTAAAGAEKAQYYTLTTAKALAMTAVDVLCSPELLQRIREAFKQAKLTQETGVSSLETAKNLQ